MVATQMTETYVIDTTSMVVTTSIVATVLGLGLDCGVDGRVLLLARGESDQVEQCRDYREKRHHVGVSTLSD